eukprot:ANDGO_07075.mRNA.1 hypothetical protein
MQKEQVVQQVEARPEEKPRADAPTRVEISKSRNYSDSRQRLLGYKLTSEEQAVVNRELKLGALRSLGGACFAGIFSFVVTRKVAAVRSNMSGFQAFMVGTGITFAGAYLPFVYSARHALAELAKFENSVLGQEAHIVLQDYDPKYIEEQRRLKAEQSQVQDRHAGAE